jgi:RNA polymerase sigma factor (sigma-70 family)
MSLFRRQRELWVKMNTTDQQLLAEYRVRGTDAAFAALVTRHVDLVYSAALRQVGEPALAQDVTQAVFIVLSRKVKTVENHPAIAGWLLRTTRFASLKALRAEGRRRRIEQEAFEMNSNAEEATWQRIAPLLDEAIGKLGEMDRNALVLRFFENKSYAEVAEATGTTEDAAKKRVSRALERLRARFLGHKAPVSTTSLATCLATASVKAAPVGMGAIVLANGAGTASSSAGWALARETIHAMFWSKLQVVASFSVLVVLATGTAGLAAWKAQQPAFNTPKSALQSLARAFSEGDGQKFVKGLYLTINDSPAKGAEWKPVIAKLVTAQGNFRKAAVNQFGANAVSNAIPLWRSIDRIVSSLEHSEERIDGQQAKFPLKAFGQAVPEVPLMLKTNHQWKLAVDLRFAGGKKISGGKNGSFSMRFQGEGLHLALERRAAFDLETAQTMLDSWANSLNQLAKEIRTGKISSADNASAQCEKALTGLTDLPGD